MMHVEEHEEARHEFHFKLCQINAEHIQTGVIDAQTILAVFSPQALSAEELPEEEPHSMSGYLLLEKDGTPHDVFADIEARTKELGL